LLREADRLTDQGLHPTAIERGYREGLDSALDAIDRTARPLSVRRRSRREDCAHGDARPQVRVRPSQQVAEVVDEVGVDASDSIRVVSRPGGATAETEVVRGVVLERGPHPRSHAPFTGRDGIAVLSSTVDVPTWGSQLGDVTRRVVFDADSFEDREGVAAFESKRSQNSSRPPSTPAVAHSSRNGRSTSASRRETAAEGILGIQRVDTDELRQIARTTDATIVPSLDQVSESTLGRVVSRSSARPAGT